MEDVLSMWSTFWIGDCIVMHMVKQGIISQPLQMVGGQEGVQIYYATFIYPHARHTLIFGNEHVYIVAL